MTYTVVSNNQFELHTEYVLIYLDLSLDKVKFMQFYFALVN